jgi:putative sigma-54 modulation protein
MIFRTFRRKLYKGDDDMQISFTFRNIEPSDYLKAYVQEKLDRMDKLLERPGNAVVVLKTEHPRRIAEVNLTSDRLSIHAKEENDDMHAAIDIVSDKVKNQLTKRREKLQDRRTRPRNISENRV